MNSEKRIVSYHSRIYKLLDKADLNKKFFFDYIQKSKNENFYNYLCKKYSYEKKPNQTISENKDTISSIYMNGKGPKLNILNNNELNNNNNDNNSFYMKNYGVYKNVFK